MMDRCAVLEGETREKENSTKEMEEKKICGLI
jgi:hypothetical protein